MKHLYAFLCIILLSACPYHIWAQRNMVYNGNFEDHSSCPFDGDQVYKCNNWRAYHTGSSDYFNTCANNSVGVPSNAWGYEVPASGNAYVGLYIGRKPDSTDYKEYVAGIVDSLTPGAAYEVSISVSLGDVSMYAGNGLGVWFYNAVPQITGSSGLPVTPQVAYSQTVTDKSGWTRLSKIFVPDSAYSNLVIGGFVHSIDIDTLPVKGGRIDWIYYFIDSVTVRKVSRIQPVLTDSVYCTGDTMAVPFELYGQGYFTDTNTFQLQLSDPSGSFANYTVIAAIKDTVADTFTYVIPKGITPGSNYRVRIISNNYADTSAVSRPIVIGNTLPTQPVAHCNSPICTGQALYLTASSATSGVRYTWSGPRGFFDNKQNTEVPIATTGDSGPYVVTTWLYGCSSSDTVDAVVVHVIGSVSSKGTNPVCTGDTLFLTGKPVGKPVSYNWHGPNGFMSSSMDTVIIHPTLQAQGDYIFMAQFNGCSDADTIHVGVKQSPVGVVANVNDPLCTGNDIKLAGSSASNGVQYYWTGPGGYDAEAANAIIKNADSTVNGSYIFTANLDGCYVRDTVAIAVHAIPDAPIAVANNPLLIGDILRLTVVNPEFGISYSWKGPDNFVAATSATALNSVLKKNAGIYVVTATKDGCSANDSVNITIGGDDNIYKLQVYPNANNGNFTIYAVTKYDQQVHLSISSSNGQMIYEQTAATQNKIIKVNVSLKDVVSSGVYTLRAQIDGGVQDVRVVINRQ